MALAELVGCKECDTLYKKEPLAAGEKAFCICCGAELYQPPKSLTTLLALVVTALIVFVVANSYPIISIELDGNHSETTLMGAVVAMFDIDHIFVGCLILMTTFIVPLVNILLLLYVLTSVTILKVRPKFLVPALHLIFLFRIWGMIEVFLIGVLVTLVKLVGMVVVTPGIALWAFAVLSLLMIRIASVKLQDIWDEVDRCLP
ncbi:MULTISPECIES: paraquat-inducible protein A [unclassified Acinetobacter]|uniref:paraquat-inducible protein A n=1 Tax=unclassified Acinetobacter TaxID=196816 RepID=UPI002934FA26|nr:MULTISPECIES: paraquat-inducible protein A [unclassified Acinetobacter]WOE33110.1 paraquat-inducible protein A [Acinetobacter sp. SAAs470]WOE39936.1 paraquat-inducible protein A [Acinetobacter sp. SAAs474]